MVGQERVMWLRKIILLSVAFLLTACDAPKLPSPFHASDVTAKFTQATFQLTDQHGQTRTLADFQGKVVLVFFGYTHCPDVCPTTLSNLAQVMRSLDKEANKVQVLFVTLDPERDKPEMLAKYVSMFNPKFLALSGDAQATAQAAKSFNVIYQKQPTTSGYNLDHTDGIFIIDPKGKVRLLAPNTQRGTLLVEDIRLLLTGV
jgi:protein SCO1